MLDILPTIQATSLVPMDLLPTLWMTHMTHMILISKITEVDGTMVLRAGAVNRGILFQ